MYVNGIKAAKRKYGTDKWKQDKKPCTNGQESNGQYKTIQNTNYINKLRGNIFGLASTKAYDIRK